MALDLIAVFFFVLGTIIASFVGVVVARLHTGQSFVRGRSHCDGCNKQLAATVMIPIFSHLVSRGRASCCGARLSPTSPLAEVILGGLFAAAYCSVGFSYALPALLLALAILLALVLYDLMHQILPPKVLYLFVATSFLAGFLMAPSSDDFYQTLGTGALMALFLALIHFLSGGRAMGFADAPLVFGLSVLTGAAAFSGFIFSFWIGAVIGIVVLLGRPRGSRIGVEVPFAPFLAAGFLLAYFTQWNPFFLIAAALSR